MLKGKGFFVWQVAKVLENMGVQDVNVAIRQAKAAGIEHVIVKIADGAEPFPIPSRDSGGRQEALTESFINVCRQEGLDVWGWAFVYGQGVDVISQAERFAQRAEQFALNYIVVNAEDIGTRTWSSAAGATRARQYITHLRQKMVTAFAPRMVEAVFPPPSEVVIGFSSYRYMSYHPKFPFDEFMAGCDIAMPQVYWVANGEGDAVRNLRGSYKEYKERYPNKLFVPTGAAYGEWYGTGNNRYFWSATPSQITHFMEQARALNLPGVTFWSWQHAYKDSQNQLYQGTQLWDALAAHPYSQPVTTGGTSIKVGVHDAAYQDGIYGGNAEATLTSYIWKGHALRFAPTSVDKSHVWAQWQPQITQSGFYEVSVWVPGNKATTRSAHYELHGVVGAYGSVTIRVNQNELYDVWVPLGTYELDAQNPMSGRVTTTNVTGETGRLIAFSHVQWQKVTPPITEVFLADGFDAPIGTAEERRAAKIWPGHWTDANPFGNVYQNAIHTGADLNLNFPTWDADKDKPVYAIASGVVTFAGHKPVWGQIVIVRHDPLIRGGGYVYSRSAHLGELYVQTGQRVQRGQSIGTVGRELPHNPYYHLHFDISPTEVLSHSPHHWPGMNRALFDGNYIDPKAFIGANRPPSD